MKRVLLVVVIVVGAASAMAIGWTLCYRQAEQGIRAVALAHQLEKVGLCEGALNSLVMEDSDRSVLVLEHWMASSLVEANRLLSSGVSVEQAIPSLYEGVRRAALYAERDGVSPTLRQQAQEVLELLDGTPGRDAS